MLQALERDLSPRSSRSSRSVSLYNGSESNHDLSSVGVSSSGASTPTGSRGGGKGRILRGGSFCSSTGSESEASSACSRQILAGRSFASSDGGDDAASELSYRGELSAQAGPPAPLEDQDVMGYAQALKPLLVTRKDLARVLSRVPEAVMLGPPTSGSADSSAEVRELLDSILSSIVAVVHVPGKGDCLAFASGLSYADCKDPYNLGRLRTTLCLRAKPWFLAPMAGRRPAPVPEEVEDPAAAESTREVAELAPVSNEVLEFRLTDISSRDLFLAELVGPFGAALHAAAMDTRCTSRALRHRRHALRRAKDALSLVLRGSP